MGLILGLAQWIKGSIGIATAVVPIQTLTWDPPHATGAAIKKKKREREKKAELTDITSEPTEALREGEVSMQSARQ